MKLAVNTLVAVLLAVLPPLGGVCLGATPRAATDASAASRASREAPAALLSLSDDELARRAELDVTSLGSLSIGSPGGAILVNPVVMPPGPHWEIAPTAESWGTAETIMAIEAAIDKVSDVFPDSPPLLIGDISAADGGRLKRHASHQGGRDADLGFYFKGGPPQGFLAGTAANMDLPRNWALIRALVTEADVEAIFLDTRVQRILYTVRAEHLGGQETGSTTSSASRAGTRTRSSATSAATATITTCASTTRSPRSWDGGFTRSWLRRAFWNRRSTPCATSSAPARRWGTWPARYGTSVGAIQRANGLTSTRLRAGRAYRIPVRAAAPPSVPLVVPPRLLPPTTPAVMASVAWPTSGAAPVAVPVNAAVPDPESLVRLFLVY